MIINLTQHPATPAQKSAGVVDLGGRRRELLKKWLTFEELPGAQEINERADYIAALAVHNDPGPESGDDPFPSRAMIGGAPYLMAPLEKALRDQGVEPIYAFSRRETAERTLSDGGVKKVTTFIHEGFVGLES